MSCFAHHNSEIDWRMGEVKMTRCPDKCGKQWRLKQGKHRWWKQNEKEKKKEEGKERKQKKKEEKKRKLNRKRIMEIKKVAEKWEIWDEKEVKRLVPECFYKWIYIFEKKQSERMPTRKP